MPPTPSSSSTSSSRILTQPLPKLIAFDLDYTLWPFWVDTHITTPLRASSGSGGGEAIDGADDTLSFYPDVPAILGTLKAEGVVLAAASRTHTPGLARQLLGLLSVPVAAERGDGDEEEEEETAEDEDAGEDGDAGTEGGEGQGNKGEQTPRLNAQKALDVFNHLAIYPGSKISHFQEIHAATGIAYDEMLFFDDESRNRNVESLGVTMCLVDDGVRWGELERGIAEWRARQNGRGGKEKMRRGRN